MTEINNGIMQLSSAFSFFFFFHKRIWYSKNFRSVANFYMTQCLLLQHSDISLPITKLIRDPRTTCWASCRYGARVDSIRLESLDLERNSFPSLTTDFFSPAHERISACLRATTATTRCSVFISRANGRFRQKELKREFRKVQSKS